MAEYEESMGRYIEDAAEISEGETSDDQPADQPDQEIYGVTEETPGTDSFSFVRTTGKGKGRLTSWAKGLGHGKGGKGVTPARFRKILKPAIECLSKDSMRRLARRGGVRRTTTAALVEARHAVFGGAATKDYPYEGWLRKVVRDAVTFTEHARRKTVTALDVVYALKRNGVTYYGDGGSLLHTTSPDPVTHKHSAPVPENPVVVALSRGKGTAPPARPTDKKGKKGKKGGVS
jgi:histone H4